MKWIIVLALVLLILVALAGGIGLLLPEKHRASESARFRASAAQLWEVITHFEAYPTWRSGLARVARQADINGHPVWQEIDSRNKVVPFETGEFVPGQRLVRRIADPKLPFGGTWTFELEPTAEGVMLTITEDGEVYHPIFRFISRFIMGHNSNIHGYLNDLQAKLSEAAK